MKSRKRNITRKKLKEDMGRMMSEILMIKDHIRSELQPKMEAFMFMFEDYVTYKNDMDKFMAFLEGKDESKKIKFEEPKTRKKKQTTGSRTAKTGRKNGKGVQSGSVQS